MEGKLLCDGDHTGVEFIELLRPPTRKQFFTKLSQNLRQEINGMVAKFSHRN
jgi:hypothetical protein